MNLFKKLFYKIRRMLGFTDEVFYINGSQTLPPPLTAEEEQIVMANISAGKKTRASRSLRITCALSFTLQKNLKRAAPAWRICFDWDNRANQGGQHLLPRAQYQAGDICFTRIENEILMFLRKSSQLKNEISIDEPLNIDWDGNELLLSDVLGSDSDIVNRNIEQEAECNLLLDAVSKLGQREKKIMELRFGLSGNKEHTQKEVADLLGISQSYISRLEKKIIDRLKKDLSPVL